MWKLIFLLFFCVIKSEGYLQWDITQQNAFDLSLYEDVLDPEKCVLDLGYILQNTSLLSRFQDAGVRTPRSITRGNLVDLGSYHHCLAIQEDSMDIAGKYCMINVPVNQNLALSGLSRNFPLAEVNEQTSTLKGNTQLELLDYNLKRARLQVMTEGMLEDIAISLEDLSFRLAVCIPKTCTAREALEAIYLNVGDLDLNYQEEFCRLPNDKPWVPADYVAISLFSLIGLLTILSTFYDVRQTVFLRKDQKQISTLYRSFSVYTNTRRLLNFPVTAGSLECLDGLRAIAMMWVILGHSFSVQLYNVMANPLDGFEWTMAITSLWVTSATITVDTFFMLSGLLIVYTTVGKLSSMKLLKNLHLFYLNRLLRMFPILATAVLLQVSLFNHLTDGPNWVPVANKVHRCRTFWWSTLLYIQNILNTQFMCIGHSWYLAVDVQLHILSPLVLFWVLSKRRRTAWISLVAGLLVSLSAATTYNFIMDFSSVSNALAPVEEQLRYSMYYYVNTLPRASPFFVGMAFGYLLHSFRERKVHLTRIQAGLIWLCAVALSTTVIYTHYPIRQTDWDNQVADNMINSFLRPAWALALGWMIFACVHGYGGPINWLLSLRMWKLPARLSYAMYIFHYPLIFIMYFTEVSPVYFSVQSTMYKFVANFTISFLVSFVVTLLIDSPFSIFIKLLMGEGIKKRKTEAVDEDASRQKKSDNVN